MSEAVHDSRNHNILESLTRRAFLSRAGGGIGAIALSSLLRDETRAEDPLAPRAPMRTPRAKRVLYLHMAGSPSQLDLFDYKPWKCGVAVRPPEPVCNPPYNRTSTESRNGGIRSSRRGQTTRPTWGRIVCIESDQLHSRIFPFIVLEARSRVPSLAMI